MKKIKIISAVGARPNFVKLAPFAREADRYKEKIEHLIIHTGQHYDVELSRDFFTALSIPEPDSNLEVGSGPPSYQIAAIMQKFGQVCEKEHPEWVVVFGDVNSTLACSLTAKTMGIKVAHVEAGLRSFDNSMPEELNRRLTDAVSDLLFTHSAEAEENLRKEGAAGLVKPVGNIMIDTLVNELPRLKAPACPGFEFSSRGFAYITIHRPSNVDDPKRLQAILKEINQLSKTLPVIFAMHPRTSACVKRLNLPAAGAGNLKITGPLAYHESLYCAKHARFIITDSGGLQEESAYLGTPCLTLRPNTERPVTIRCGTNRLTSPESLSSDIRALEASGRPDHAVPSLWDGRTARRIIETFL